MTTTEQKFKNDETSTPKGKLEPVLLVPPRLTKTTYAILMNDKCVPRPWHLDGQYGSRTHAIMIQDENSTEMVKKMGIPIMLTSARLFVKFRSSWNQQYDDMEVPKKNQDGDKDTNDDDNNDDKNLTCFEFSEELKKLLVTEGVDIVYRTVPIPKNKLSIIQSINKSYEVKSEESLKIIKFQIPKAFPDCSPSEPKKQKQSPLFTFAELFCGIGGFGVALEALGGQCIFASEIDQDCRQVFLENIQLPTKCPLYGDITKVTDDQFPSPSSSLDLLVAGFPCQPFSSSGDQPGLDDENGRGLLYTHIIRFLRVSQPKAFLLENVPGLLGTDSGKAYETILSSLQSEAGYDVTVKTISSRGLTAQSRKRVYFVGFKQNSNNDPRAKFEFPSLPELGIRADDVIQYDNDVHESYSLSDAQMNQLLQNYHSKQSWKPAKLLVWPNSVCRTVDSHYGISVGKGNSQLVPCLAPKHPRRFTIRECARIMGFPNSYRFPHHSDNTTDGIISSMNYKKKLYHMLGNAVCPPVIAAISGCILACCPDILRCEEMNDWESWGMNTAISLSLSCIKPEKRDSLIERIRLRYPLLSSLNDSNIIT